MPYNVVVTCRHEAMMRISGPNFVVGAVLHDHVVVKAAPLIKYMIGWRRDRVIWHCKHKGWQLETIMEFDF